MAKNTDQYIIATVAPIFNKKGYVATTLSDLTKATGLTKGAIYGNFENKEELAVKVFKWNVKRAIGPLAELLAQTDGSYNRLRAIIRFYRSYFSTTYLYGGCPILNVGNDARYNNVALFEAAQLVSSRLLDDIREIVEEGIANGELDRDTEPERIARNIFSCIEGGIYMSTLHDDESYLQNVLDSLEISLKRIKN